MTRENTEAKAFAGRLRELMQARGHVSPTSHSGIDVAKLAEVSGTSYEMARRYAEGLAIPRPEKLAAIARWLGVTPAALAYGAAATPTAIDERLLEQCLRAVREAQDRAGLRLPPAKAAHLVAVLYGEAASGELPSPRSVDLMLRAAS